MTREEILAMSPKELAEATATHVMGWIIISEREDLARRQTASYVQGRGIVALYGDKYVARSDGRSREWNPAEDLSSAWEVEGMFKDYFDKQGRYVSCLKEAIGEIAYMFDFIHATPEQRCKAALLAVLGEEEAK